MIRFIALSCMVLSITGLGYLNSGWLENPVDTTPMEPGSEQSGQVDNTIDISFTVEHGDVLQTSRVQTFSRPLFNETRRKILPPKKEERQVIQAPKIEAVIEDETPAEHPNIQLAGISIQPDYATALIIDLDTNATLWFAINGVIQDWRVTTIEKEYILLSSAGENIKFNLYEKLPLADDENE